MNPPATSASPKPLIIGTGNPHWGDSVAGLLAVRETARRLRERGWTQRVDTDEVQADAFTLLAHMRRRTHVIVIDTVHSTRPPGYVERLEGREGARYGHMSATHGAPLADAMTWAAATGRLPTNLTLFLISGATFAPGQRVTPEVRQATEAVADELVTYVLPDLLGERVVVSTTTF